MTIAHVWEALGLEAAPEAVLWDMDGTIVDTGEQWGALSEKVVREAGGLWSKEDTAFVVGTSSSAHAQRVADAVARGGGERPEPEEIFAELLQEMATIVYPRVELLAGAEELLRAFRDAGIAQVLVTATPANLVEIARGSLGQMYVNALVTGSDHVAPKPDPAPYLLGARRVASDIRRCLVFEDSRAGLAAARASGATTVDVTSMPLSALAERLS
ncbi:HAD family hydrolase [Trueperella pecoris]|uniref:HAD family hydrolase n=1 Tax=Trueperella pecoris TaxID=2733571 RepID=UPI00186B812A|nr:HAD family phosphatase [Trueperella pecoris]QOQ38363.1 HAD family phosphatase [Trueperella pecoris]